jgi:putative transcriptional regulator|nr:MAG TPA: putative transcriptional regulator [Caudoviricetes sp.]
MTPAEQIKSIRASTGLSQAKFAEIFGIQSRTLERWESGVRNPPPYVINLLRIAVENTMPHTDPEDDHD